MDRLEGYLLRRDVPLVMKMGELAKNGPTGDFLNLWKIVRVCIWRKLREGGTLSGQELVANEKLRKMAKYRRSQFR
jgi:hypothetical protein